jgi:hypothetical protein
VRQIACSFPFGFKPRVVPPIAPVVISPLTQGNQTVSLSCVTIGAAIFYTLDGTYPSPRNPSASLYIAPRILTDENGNALTDENGNDLSSGSFISVVAGQLLKARAWLSGYASPSPEFSQFQY